MTLELKYETLPNVFITFKIFRIQSMIGSFRYVGVYRRILGNWHLNIMEKTVKLFKFLL